MIRTRSATSTSPIACSASARCVMPSRRANTRSPRSWSGCIPNSSKSSSPAPARRCTRTCGSWRPTAARPVRMWTILTRSGHCTDNPPRNPAISARGNHAGVESSGVSGEETRGRVTLPEAAGVLRLPVESVVALVGAGYLRTTTSFDDPRFAMGDLKAFLARNADGEPIVDLVDASLDDLDPQGLLDALDGRSEDMARRSLDLLTTVFPEAGRWTLNQQARFIDEARNRFEA